MKAKNGVQGFTLVEIMIAVGIIALLAVIAMPSFRRARNTTIGKIKRNNARLLASAALEWATTTGKNNSDTVSKADLTPYIRKGWEGLDVGSAQALLPGTTVDYYDRSNLDTIMNDMYP